MSDALAITEAEAAGLAELAALDLAMARDFAARAQAAEDPETANALARSYQRMARSYRQSLALKAKLRLDTQAAERETPARRFGSTGHDRGPPVPPPIWDDENDLRIDLRAEELHDAVVRVIWAEHEKADHETPEDERPENDPRNRAFERFAERLDAAVRDPDFGLEPLDDHVAAMCRALDLDPDLARRWRDLPEPAWHGSG